jgi:DNA (cytosine-5)-methyltransferase 1
MHDPILLCGSMFNLAAIEPDADRSLVLHLRRHRLFESPLDLRAPRACIHRKEQVAGVYGGGSSDRNYARHVRRGGYTPTKPIRGALLGIDWMTQAGLSQAIPPVYTQWLGGLAATQIGTP